MIVAFKWMFVYFWLHWVFVAAHRLSLVACVGFSFWWLLLLWSTGSRVCRLQRLWCTGLVAVQHVGSSWTRNWTHVPWISSRFLTTRPWGSPEILQAFNLCFPDVERLSPIKVIIICSTLVNHAFVSRIKHVSSIWSLQKSETLVPGSLIRWINKAAS